VFLDPRGREKNAPVVWTERTSLAEELWRYGEDELSKRVLLLPTRTMEAIGERADWHLAHGEARPSGDSMLIDKALALAAVEVLEGAERPLTRAKRRPQQDFPGHPRARAFIARHWLDRHATHARKVVAAAQARRD
jgi:hypothetical protein